jgi:predicted PilT family ATPase
MSKNTDTSPVQNEEEDFENLCGVVVIGAPGTGKTTFCNAL